MCIFSSHWLKNTDVSDTSNIIDLFSNFYKSQTFQFSPTVKYEIWITRNPIFSSIQVSNIDLGDSVQSKVIHHARSCRWKCDPFLWLIIGNFLPFSLTWFLINYSFLWDWKKVNLTLFYDAVNKTSGTCLLLRINDVLLSVFGEVTITLTINSSAGPWQIQFLNLLAA